VNYSLFTRQNNLSFTVLLIYVDDIILTGNDLTEMQRLKDCLLRRFRIKDFRDLKYVLGIEFSRSKAGVYMSQRKYALDTEYGTHRCSSRQILKVAIPKTHTGRWRVIKGSSQIQRTCGTTDIPHGYST